MTCEEMKLALMDYLYEELSAEEKAPLVDHLAGCASCRAESEALAQTSRVLKAWPEVAPKMSFVFATEKPSWLDALASKVFGQRQPWWRWGFALAAAAAAFALLALAVVNTELSYSKGNFQFKVSLLPRPEERTMAVATARNRRDTPGATAPAVDVDSLKEALLAELRAENRVAMEASIKASEERQRRHWNAALADYTRRTEQAHLELAQVMAQFAEEIQRQRQADLRLVGRGLEQVYLDTQRRIERTNRTLEDFIKYASFQEKK